MYASLGILIAIFVLLLVTSLKSFGINREYQRAVLFRLGRLGEMKGPGWYWLIPFVDRVVRVDPAGYGCHRGNGPGHANQRLTRVRGRQG